MRKIDIKLICLLEFRIQIYRLYQIGAGLNGKSHVTNMAEYTID